MKGTGKAWRWSWGHRGRPRALVGVVTDEQPCPGRVSARPLDDQAVLGANDVEPADVAAADRVVDEDGTPVHERRLHGFAQDLDDAAVSGDEPEALSATGFRNLMRLGDALVVKEAPTARRGGQLGDADVVGVLVAARAYAPRLKGQSCAANSTIWPPLGWLTTAKPPAPRERYDSRAFPGTSCGSRSGAHSGFHPLTLQRSGPDHRTG